MGIPLKIMTLRKSELFCKYHATRVTVDQEDSRSDLQLTGLFHSDLAFEFLKGNYKENTKLL